MLDLQARVRLHEDKAAGRCHVNQEFERAQRMDARSARERQCSRAHMRAQGGIQVRRRRDLDQLLVPALQAAFAVMKVDHLARCITQNLDLDVPRRRNELFNVQLAGAERGARLGGCSREGFVHLVQ